MPDQERKLAAIVFTDIVGYTKLAAENEPAALSLLQKQRETLKPIVEEHSGNWLKEMGDGLLLTFNTNLEAVNCAIAIQNAVKDTNDLNLRIGIHNGEVVFQGNDVVGDDVNIAARIEPFAAPGGIAISGRVNSSLERDPSFETHYLGQPQLKGVTQSVKAYCITSHGLPQTDMSQVDAKLEKEGFQWNAKNTIGIAASVLGLLFLINFLFLRVGYADKDETPSIAILPFENKGAEADEFYAYGISSDLITDVTGAGMIRVAGLNDIEKLKYDQMNYNELSKKLFVRYVAKGTLWKMDSIFQLSMEIFDTKESKVVYNKRWQTNWEDLATIKDDLSDNILETLKINILQDSESQIAESNPEAYEYYLRGKHKFEKRQNLDEIDLARGLLRKAIELDKNFIDAKSFLGGTYLNTGDYDEALDIFNSTLIQANEKRDLDASSHLTNNIGIIHFYRGNVDSALVYWEKALGLSDEIGDQNLSSGIRANMGNAYFMKGELDKTLGIYEKNVASHRMLDNKYNIANGLSNLVYLYSVNNQVEKSISAGEESITLFKDVESRRGVAFSQSNLGKTYFYNLLNLDIALDYFNISLTEFLKIDSKRMLIVSYEQIGKIHAIKGEYDEAIKKYNKSLEIAEKMKNFGSMADLNSALGMVYFYIGEFELAEEYLTKSLSTMEELNVREEVIIWPAVYLQLLYKQNGKDFQGDDVIKLLSEIKFPDYLLYFNLYKLFEYEDYLLKSYEDIITKTNWMDTNLNEKFFNYPIPKQIVEAWEKVNT